MCRRVVEMWLCRRRGCVYWKGASILEGCLYTRRVLVCKKGACIREGWLHAGTVLVYKKGACIQEGCLYTFRYFHRCWEIRTYVPLKFAVQQENGNHSEQDLASESTPVWSTSAFFDCAHSGEISSSTLSSPFWTDLRNQIRAFRPIFCHHHDLKLPHENDSCADRELRFVAFDRHKNHFRAISIGH